MSVRPMLLGSFLPFRALCPHRRAASSFANKMNDPRPLKHTPRKPVATERKRLKADAERMSNNKEATRRSGADGIAPFPISHPVSQQVNPTEAYFVQRTPTQNLPVYQVKKRGGNLHITRIRKISGETELLLKQIEQALSPKPEWIKINGITGHIEMKGWYKVQIDQLLEGKGF